MTARRADLDVFAGASSTADTATVETTVAEAARVTSIVDVPGVGSALAGKLAGAVTNALHGGHERRSDVHAEVGYDGEHAQLKIIIVGAVGDTSNFLGLLQVWLEQLTP